MSIKTFVLFDINTIGYTVQDRDNIKIVEFTLMAVPREKIVKSGSGDFQPSRIMTKLINPEVVGDINKTIANPSLSADKLKNQPVFGEVIKDVNEFLEDLPNPVCLVCLHGNRFDFKVLVSEYQQAHEALPDGLLCVDPRTFFTIQVDVQADPIPDGEAGPMNELNVLFRQMTTNRGDKINISKLYRSLLNTEPPQSQGTETTTHMLLQCVLRLKDKFLPWADRNAKPILKIKPYGQPQPQHQPLPDKQPANEPDDQPASENGDQKDSLSDNQKNKEPANDHCNVSNQTD